MSSRRGRVKENVQKRTRNRMSSESSSEESFELDSNPSSPHCSSTVDTSQDAIIASQIASPRKTRASARMCKMRLQDNSSASSEQDTSEKTQERHSIERYDFEDLCSSPRFHHPEMVTRIRPEEFNMDYYNRTGLSEVLMFECPPEELGMRMVDNSFTPRDVQKLVGNDRDVTCVKVSSQESVSMRMSDFVDYYYKPEEERGTRYNVLSLEFSNTELADKVRSPSLVRQVDWARVWPDARKQRRITFNKNGKFEVTNYFPRVENYCLMSVQKCYTDYHIDFHGTSVWYHVLKGKKIFWIIEPNEQNIRLYEEYLKNPEQSTFFGDITEKCARVEINPGCTLIIPAGWIHSVYTPVDSLVFGGNFLHTRQASMQISVLKSENRIGINKRYRYPNAEEVVFFMFAQLAKSITHRMYVRPESRNKGIMYGLQYVGEKFMDSNLHHIVPQSESFLPGSAYLTKEWDEDEEYLEWRKRAACYEKEDEYGSAVTVGEARINHDGLEEEADDEEEGKEKEEEKNVKKEEKDDDDALVPPTYNVVPCETVNGSINEETPPSIEPIQSREDVREEGGEEIKKEQCVMIGGHDDFFMDPYTFYHPESFHCDSGDSGNGKACNMHLLPLSSVEPKVEIDYGALRKEIPQGDVTELEALLKYFLTKQKVDVPYGITRPNSLLQCAKKLLFERREQLERDENITLPPSVLKDVKKNLTPRIVTKRVRSLKEETDEDWEGTTSSASSSPVKKNWRRSDEGGMSEQRRISSHTQDRARKVWATQYALWFDDNITAIRAEMPEYESKTALKKHATKTVLWMKMTESEKKKYRDAAVDKVNRMEGSNGDAETPKLSRMEQWNGDSDSPKKEVVVSNAQYRERAYRSWFYINRHKYRDQFPHIGHSIDLCKAMRPLFANLNEEERQEWIRSEKELDREGKRIDRRGSNIIVKKEVRETDAMGNQVEQVRNHGGDVDYTYGKSLSHANKPWKNVWNKFSSQETHAGFDQYFSECHTHYTWKYPHMTPSQLKEQAFADFQKLAFVEQQKYIMKAEMKKEDIGPKLYTISSPTDSPSTSYTPFEGSQQMRTTAILKRPQSRSSHSNSFEDNPACVYTIAQAIVMQNESQRQGVKEYAAWPSSVVSQLHHDYGMEPTVMQISNVRFSLTSYVEKMMKKSEKTGTAMEDLLRNNPHRDAIQLLVDDRRKDDPIDTRGSTVDVQQTNGNARDERKKKSPIPFVFRGFDVFAQYKYDEYLYVGGTSSLEDYKKLQKETWDNLPEEKRQHYEDRAASIRSGEQERAKLECSVKTSQDEPNAEEDDQEASTSRIQ